MNKTLCLTVIAMSLTLSACGPTRIGRILADPSRYQNRSVTVEGNVTNVVGAFIAGAYQVEDPTGKIYVLSTSGVPNKGVRVQVKGSVTPGVNIMGKSIGTAIREREHKVRF